MKKGISITFHIITFILLGLTITAMILMYFNNQTKFDEYDKSIKELKENNRTLTRTLNEYSETSQKDTNNSSSNETANEEELIYDISKFDKIKASDISKLSKNQTIVIMIGREGCSWCQRYIPVLQSVQEKYNFKSKYLDLSSIMDIRTGELIDEESYNILLNLSAEEEYENFIIDEFGATPLTLIIKDNKIINAFAGYIEESYLSNILEDCGFSK